MLHREFLMDSMMGIGCCCRLGSGDTRKGYKFAIATSYVIPSCATTIRILTACLQLSKIIRLSGSLQGRSVSLMTILIIPVTNAHLLLLLEPEFSVFSAYFKLDPARYA
jgi:hypothetical protein